MMDGETFAGLKADIEANGLREPIWVFDSKIIDGRNRYRVCQELGIEPDFREWDGEGDLLAFVVSLNLHRRHLDTSQRAMIAARIKPKFEAEAHQRQAHGRTAPGQSLVANLPQASEGKSREKAAELLNVSPRVVESASAVLKNGTPELVASVDKGEVKVSAASTLARLSKEEQREIVKEGPEAVKTKAREIRSQIADSSLPDQKALFDVQPLPKPVAASSEDTEDQLEKKREGFESSVNKVRGFAALLKDIEKYDRTLFRWTPKQRKALAHSLSCIRDNLDHAIRYLKGL
jgi:ParB-like chromosome segregation protein Spo0J